MIDRFTAKAREAISLAVDAAESLGHNYVGTEHLLIGLLEEGSGVAARVLDECGVKVEKVTELVSQLITPSQGVRTAEQNTYTPSAKRVIENSYREAVRFKAPLIGTEHILIAIIRENDCVASRLLNTMGISIQRLYVDVLSAMGEDADAGRDDIPAGKGARGKSVATPVLDRYSRDLTALAREGKLDPVIGRETEIQRVIQILSRRTKNNPCLMGEPGVGKTAVVEGLAQMIAAGNIPETIADKRVVTLDLSGMVAGSKYRGEFEERIKRVLAEVMDNGDVLLFIDEIHTIIGAGGAEGALDASNILKPSLARGELQLIGATTIEEYRKYIEKDSALERRFQPVTVEEPSEDETYEILKGLRGHYEKHHSVKITDEALKAAVKLSARYINDRFLPDKAIDLMDEACSCASLENQELAEYDRLMAENGALENEIEDISRADTVDYERLAEKKSQAAKLQEEISKIAPAALERPVEEEHLAKVIELWTGIPASKIQETELRRVADLEKNLQKKIIGQQEAINQVAAAVRRSRVRISPRKRPASFIFVGPTGVGKTELVKVLSQELFDNVEPLIRLDMSEYMEKHSVSRIIGSPPGYVGYDEAGQLTEKVRRRPYSIVLLDEIEKAHPDVLNILLQILDEGKITDAQGRVVSFENTILIMTSNAGSQLKEGSLGFTKSGVQMARDKAEKALSDFLRPEFLARVDEVIIFRPLTKEDFQGIAALMIDELKPSLLEKGIRFDCQPQVLEQIAGDAFGHKSGARDIRKLIRQRIEDPICVMLASGESPALMMAVLTEEGKVALQTA